MSGDTNLCHMSHSPKIEYFAIVDNESSIYSASKKLREGVLSIFVYRGMHAMFWGLKFHLKAIFCLKFRT